RRLVGDDEAGERAHEHDAIDAEVEHPRKLAEHLAERGVQVRRGEPQPLRQDARQDHQQVAFLARHAGASRACSACASGVSASPGRSPSMSRRRARRRTKKSLETTKTTTMPRITSRM